MKKVVFLIALFVMFLSRAQAETVHLVSDRFDDTYVYYYDSNYGRTRYLEASKYSFNGNIAYCVEIGKYISSSLYETSFSFDEIDIKDDDLDYIKTVSYYGYNYPGHQTDRFYMATQELIWTRLIRTNIKWTNGFNPDSFTDLSNEKEEIYSLFRKHNTKPSFDDKNIDFVMGKELVLEDSNNVLFMYKVLNDNAYIDGNKLIISKDFNEKEIILERIKYSDKNFILYSSGNSQKMITAGGIDLPSSKININLIGGKIKINKYDSENLSNVPQGDGTLIGAKYGLYDLNNSLIDTFVIGKKELIDNLPLGEYYIKEIKPSVGYNLDTNIYHVNMNENNLDINLNVYENVIKRKVDIFKVFASNETGIMIGEKDIIFEIYDKDNNLIDSIITDEDGYASILLPYGIYTFKQVNSTDGYYKVPDFNVNIDTNDERPIYKLLSDSEIKARVKVIKKDVDTLENIVDSNIKFKIFDINNNKYVSFNTVYPTVGIIDTFELNENGEFITPLELHSGKYILYEVDGKMDGYLYNSEGIYFDIDNNSNFISDDTFGNILEINFYNKRVKGKIIINKYGEDIIYKDNDYFYKDVFLDDVWFNLYAKDDIFENGNLIYSKDEFICKIVTDDGGVGAYDDLPLGNYYLVETKSNNGNVISDKIYDIDLSYKDQYTKKVVNEIDVYNYLEKGKLIINKYDKNTNERLSNTLIEICNINGEVVYKGYTNSDGMIILDDFLYGEYYISEVEASTGYKILDDKIYFNMDKEELEIDIYNERINVPNTGVNSLNIIFIFLIMICFIVMFIFFENKKVVILVGIMISFMIIYLGNYYYRYYDDNRKNSRAINDYISDKIDDDYDRKYQYKAILEIPSVNIKRGVLDINNEYNKAKYNIELVKEDDKSIVVASHNGNNYNSFFGNLHNLEIGDEIKYYYNGKIYTYIYSESYSIKKNGYADLYYKNDKCIILITCMEKTNDSQVVYVAYLKSVNSYEE